MRVKNLVVFGVPKQAEREASITANWAVQVSLYCRVLGQTKCQAIALTQNRKGSDYQNQAAGAAENHGQNQIHHRSSIRRKLYIGSVPETDLHAHGDAHDHPDGHHLHGHEMPMRFEHIET